MTVSLKDNIFLAYGADSPQYPRFLGDYGADRPSVGIAGSLIVVTGGDMSPSPCGGEPPNVFVDGARNLYADAGHRFIERAITGLVDQQSYVVFVAPVLDLPSYEALDTARSAGLRVTADKEAVEVGNPLSCAVVTGQALMLLQLEWMDFTCDLLPYYLLVSRSAATEFSVAATVPGLTGGNVYESVESTILDIDREPSCVLDKLGDYELLLSPADSHLRSFRINRRETDLSPISELFCASADDLPITLHDVGHLGSRDESGSYFTDFTGFEQWQPMPGNWKKVRG